MEQVYRELVLVAQFNCYVAGPFGAGLTGCDIQLEVSLPGLLLQRGERGAGAGRPSRRQQPATSGLAAPRPVGDCWEPGAEASAERLQDCPQLSNRMRPCKCKPLIWDQAPPPSRYVCSHCCNPFMVTGLGRTVSSQA